jgi:hypothetical protein
MSNPSVTATISADDQASPKLRELLALSQKLAATAKSIFNEGGAGSAYMQLIATRHYSDWHPVTLEPFEMRDRMYRKACGSFVLMVAGELPGDSEVEKSLSLESVFEWLRDCPEQIERAVIDGVERYSGQ